MQNQVYDTVSVFLERCAGILLLCVLVIVMSLLRLDLYVRPYVYIPAIGGFVALLLVSVIALAGNSSGVSKRIIERCLDGVTCLARFPVLNRMKGLHRLLEGVRETVVAK